MTAVDAALATRPTATATLGDWRLLDEIGRGAWTRVYLARPASARRARLGCYAVKALDALWAADPLAVASLRREALVGMTVSHPHLLSVLAAHVHEPPHYLVAPFLPGTTVAEKLRSGWLTVRTALWIARQVASALAALHAAGWLHRDVKPSNVIVSPTGHATLVDLGLAERRDRAAATDARPVVGTLDYLAPEAFTSGMACSTATDLYGLGVTLFEMLSGNLPFRADSAGELAEKHRRAAARLTHVRPEVPRELAELTAELLAKQPLRRPSSADEVAQRLVRMEIESLLNGETGNNGLRVKPTYLPL